MKAQKGKKSIRKTQKEAEEELSAKFPNIIITSQYKSAKEKVNLKCLECRHEWTTSYLGVLNTKHGCPKCGCKKANLSKSKEKFLKELPNDFELIDYKNYKDVTVKCKKCGHVRHTTGDNIKRFGCKPCKMKPIIEAQAHTTEDFIKMARDIHGDKYDYSKVNYSNGKEKVTIICPEHGEFKQAPIKHVYAQHGCPKCAGFGVTKEEFIKRSKEVHGDFYDYSKVKFINTQIPVTLICPKHGDFLIEPSKHYNAGCGCKQCFESSGEKLVNSILTILKIPFEREKIIENPYNNHNFRVDFYFELNREIYIIEYNGEQHYRPINLFGGEHRFQIQTIRDEDLRKYCKENNINLLEIKYSETNINSLILNFINVPSDSEMSRLLEDKNGEFCDENIVLTSSITQGGEVV